MTCQQAWEETLQCIYRSRYLCWSKQKILQLQESPRGYWYPAVRLDLRIGCEIYCDTYESASESIRSLRSLTKDLITDIQIVVSRPVDHSEIVRMMYPDSFADFPTAQGVTLRDFLSSLTEASALQTLTLLFEVAPGDER